MNAEWLVISGHDLEYEKRQLVKEGVDISPIESKFDTLIKDLKRDEPEITEIQDRADKFHARDAYATAIERQDEVKAVIQEAQSCPQREDYPFEEPGDLGEIRDCRPSDTPTVDEDPELVLEEHVQGAWVGRCAGCLLGKPVEGWPRDRIVSFLRETRQHPLASYIRGDVSPDILASYNADPDHIFGATIDRIDHMVEDDDINYTILGQSILETDGASFTSEDVAEKWLTELPLLRLYTAERIAYRNLTQLIYPPNSATNLNPCREWIGALIRADAYGFISPGDPERAAEFAWRDARVSHTRNGIYGSMWVASILAAAPLVDSTLRAIEIGTGQIPKNARLSKALQTILDRYREGWSFSTVVDRIHAQWDETDFFQWVHTIPNAQIITAALLWSGGDFEKAICSAVTAGFDTDSTAATCGSIMGMLNGIGGINRRWVAPLGDRVETPISGYADSSISALAGQSVELAEQLRH